jgi:hypothetical protein
MDTMAEQALLEFVGERPQRSREVTVTLQHNFFQVLCRRNKKPSKGTVKKWWAVLQQPLDDTNSYSILNLVRRALLDWPKMGAAIAQMAQQEHVLARKEQALRKKVAAKVAQKLEKQRALEAVPGVDASSFRTNNSDQKCIVKLPRCNISVVQK